MSVYILHCLAICDSCSLPTQPLWGALVGPWTCAYLCSPWLSLSLHLKQLITLQVTQRDFTRVGERVGANGICLQACLNRLGQNRSEKSNSTLNQIWAWKRRISLSVLKTTATKKTFIAVRVEKTFYGNLLMALPQNLCFLLSSCLLWRLGLTCVKTENQQGGYLAAQKQHSSTGLSGTPHVYPAWAQAAFFPPTTSIPLSDRGQKLSHAPFPAVVLVSQWRRGKVSQTGQPAAYTPKGGQASGLYLC